MIYKICAWYGLIIIVLATILQPFSFGKSREPYNAVTWLIGMVLSIPLLVLFLSVILD